MQPATRTGSYRVIAEGDDGIARELSIEDALAMVEFARDRGLRHVAIVDEETGAMIDERDARRRFLRRP